MYHQSSGIYRKLTYTDALFVLSDRCGLTWRQLSSSVGIHPTTAEELVKLHITKSSGLDPKVTGC
ncbi:Thioredoxin reductase 2, mitochondrial [Mizuhopecten yessoensis]|uniref:Thioredoxin reductase 2, mitochondrial n=1 Tax=Mizuhopecten yessoensis TaxID=6573 RepID=A0A210R232_MIZYE|nr:Thioredoxin reductase 2, mitochondrial [Mizuhopecten yessoensis]